VREAVERARVPFERILDTGHSPWSANDGGAGEKEGRP
jgi:hypothetical protein